jgi:hypothetical protein
MTRSYRRVGDDDGTGAEHAPHVQFLVDVFRSTPAWWTRCRASSSAWAPCTPRSCLSPSAWWRDHPVQLAADPHRRQGRRCAGGGRQAQPPKTPLTIMRIVELRNKVLPKDVLHVIPAGRSQGSPLLRARRSRRSPSLGRPAAAPRVLVQRGIAEEFTRRLAAGVAALRVGDPRRSDRRALRAQSADPGRRNRAGHGPRAVVLGNPEAQNPNWSARGAMAITSARDHCPGRRPGVHPQSTAAS